MSTGCQMVLALLLAGMLSGCVPQAVTPSGSQPNTRAEATQQVPPSRPCAAFTNRVWAQSDYDDDPKSNKQLDPDGDGLACEELPLGLAPAFRTNHVPEDAIPAALVSVTDGDTIEVRLDGRLEAVRMVGIDAEEAGGPYRDVECFGPEATDFLSGWLAPGDRLYLERDQENRDPYGRLLRWVWLERDGEVYLLNEALVRAGYAERYRNTPNRRYLDEVRAAEAFAQRHGLGLWGACD